MELKALNLYSEVKCALFYSCTISHPRQLFMWWLSSKKDFCRKVQLRQPWSYWGNLSFRSNPFQSWSNWNTNSDATENYISVTNWISPLMTSISVYIFLRAEKVETLVLRFNECSMFGPLKLVPLFSRVPQEWPAWRNCESWCELTTGLLKALHWKRVDTRGEYLSRKKSETASLMQQLADLFCRLIQGDH